MTNLKSTPDKQSLLETLVALYEKISQQWLHERLKSYHNCLSDNIHEDLIQPLSKVLDKLTAVNTVNQGSSQIRTHYLSSKRYLDNNESGQNLEQTIHSSTLSAYFKVNNHLFTPHPGICEKLMLSIMDNIHASIRLARQGDCDTSRLHMGIARSAIDELSHFMETRKFKEFTREIKYITTHVAHYDYRVLSDNKKE